MLLFAATEKTGPVGRSSRSARIVLGAFVEGCGCGVVDLFFYGNLVISSKLKM